MSTLNPYSGPWTFSQAAHLLRRTTFGPSYTDIKSAVNQGLSNTIDTLLAPLPAPEPPIHHRFDADPGAPIGETWVNLNEPIPGVPGLNNARKRSLKSWMMGLMIDSPINIRSKMLLFWHEHLPINSLTRGQIGYKYCQTLLTHTLGNFKTLIEDITIDPAMLLFLNGHQNSVQSPNENYARELLELFSIGRGLEAGPGDYTNYTEQDVREVARILTGWRANISDDAIVAGAYRDGQHDKDSKQLSPRLNNIVINDQGAEEYKTIIDIIFQQSEVARFICRKLHIWFISPRISADVELNIIEPLAQILIDNNYEIQPVIATLLSSEYFFTDSHIGCTISHPLDFMAKVVNTFEYGNFQNKVDRYKYYDLLNELTIAQEMVLLEIPSVAGWKAFYQGPQYDKVWINSISLKLRETFTDLFVEGITLSGTEFRIDVLAFIEQFDDVYDPNVLIEECIAVLFAYPISQNQHDFLKNLLIPGLPDASWTMEYSEYLADPTNPDRIEGITNRLKAMFQTILKMPEFYLN